MILVFIRFFIDNRHQKPKIIEPKMHTVKYGEPIKIQSNDDDGIIYYTTDGSVPTQTNGYIYVDSH
jgi:hypothetical protein